MMPDQDGPSPAKLKQTLEFVFDAELSSVKISAVIQGEGFLPLVQVVKQPWQTILTASLKQRMGEAAVAARSGKVLIIQEALTELQGVNIGLDDDALDLILAAKPTKADFAASPPGVNYQYLFTSFIQITDGWKGIELLLQTAKTDCLELIMTATRFQTFAEAQVTGQQDSFLACTGAIAQARPRAGQLTMHPTLGPCLGPVATYLTTTLDDRADMIVGCDGPAASALMLTFTAPSLAEVTNTKIVLQIWPLHQTCDNVRARIGHLLTRLDDPALAALAKVANTQQLRAKLKYLLDTFGGPGFLALTGLDPAVQVKVIERFSALRAYLLDNVDKDCSTALISTFFTLSAAGNTEQNGRDALLSGNVVKVTVPATVTAMGWQICNGIRFPQAFSVGTISTDQACIKHVLDDCGPTPSLDKLNRDFADMVKACQAAGTAWTKAGKPNMFVFPIKVGHANWTIIVGSERKKVIHHIDSGYKDSWWFTAT